MTENKEKLDNVAVEETVAKKGKAKKTVEKKVELIGSKVNATEVLEKLGGYPAIGSFEDKKALQKFYKQLDTEVLEDWAAQEGLEYTANENAPIHRMRVAMAILYAHYPKEPAKKKESRYAKYSLEDLLTLAMDKDVIVEPTDDARIMRMRTIVALRDAGVIEA